MPVITVLIGRVINLQLPRRLRNTDAPFALHKPRPSFKFIVTSSSKSNINMMKQVLFLLSLVAVVVSGIGLDDQLIEAVVNEDMEAINATIGAGGNVNVVVDGNTPIAYGVWLGNYGAVDTLIVNGADVNGKDSEGVSLLSAAAKRGHTATAQLLLQSGAVLTAMDFGMTAFHYTCEAGFKNTAQMFLESGASPTDPTEAGLTPLELVAGNIQMQQLIMQFIVDEGEA